MTKYIIFVVIIMIVSFTNGAHIRHRRYGDDLMNSLRDNFKSPQWINPCNVVTATNITTTQTTQYEAKQIFKQLRKESQFIKSKMDEPKTNAIDTSGISQWFTSKNATYAFLPRLPVTKCPKKNLRNWHAQTQIFVGAFQHLYVNQAKKDAYENVNKDSSDELKDLFQYSRQLLCEIETAINNTKNPNMPVVLTKESMDERLSFPNKSNTDDLDNQFTKVRFHEYVNSLRSILRTGKTKEQKDKRKQCLEKKQHKKVLRNLERQSRKINNRKNLNKLLDTKKRKNRKQIKRIGGKAT